MPAKSPLGFPRDVISGDGELSPQMRRKGDDTDKATVAPNGVVYEVHKRSSRLSVFKSTSRGRSAKDEIRQEEEEFPSRSLSYLASHPEPFLPDSWSEPGGESFRVRGRTYIADGVKQPAGPSLFRLLTADIVEVTSSLPGGSVCLDPNGRVQPALRRGGADFPPYLFCVNIRIPHPAPGREYHIATYFAVDDVSQIDGTGATTPHSRLAERFFFGDSDEFRDSTFKFVPRIVEGNPLVKKAVGVKPVIMGKKLKQSYLRTDRFFELIIDVGSDKVANKIVKMCIGYAKSIVVDMAFILEGKHEDVLPERVLGAVRLKNIDFKNQRRLVKV